VGQRRLTWRNHSHDQSCHPGSIEHPASSNDLVRLVREAEERGTTIRAVGAGHSWSDVALTDGILLETDMLSGVSDADDGTLRAAASTNRSLVRVMGGTRVHELNDRLDERGLALPNMGGYDAQSIAGVVSTSTHGSGIWFGPFPDFVRSLDLVVAGAKRVRLEPTDGITVPDAFAARPENDDIELIRNDELFYAAVCGMGCVGIVESLVLEVRREFWLRERRVLSTWEEAREELEDGVLDTSTHWELFLNPYARKDGRHELLVTTRDEVPKPDDGGSDGAGMRHPLVELEAKFKPFHWFLRRAHPVREHAEAAARRQLHPDLLQGVQHRRGEQAARLLDGAGRGRARRQPPADGRPHPRAGGRERTQPQALPHVTDRAAVRGALARVRLDDARRDDDDDRADPGLGH
jgi:hypothetical protein